MKVILVQQSDDNLSRMVDIANKLLTNNNIHEVEIQFGDVSRFMRTCHDTEQIRKFIYREYEEK